MSKSWHWRLRGELLIVLCVYVFIYLRVTCVAAHLLLSFRGENVCDICCLQNKNYLKKKQTQKKNGNKKVLAFFFVFFVLVLIYLLLYFCFFCFFLYRIFFQPFFVVFFVLRTVQKRDILTLPKLSSFVEGKR